MQCDDILEINFRKPVKCPVCNRHDCTYDRKTLLSCNQFFTFQREHDKIVSLKKVNHATVSGGN